MNWSLTLAAALLAAAATLAAPPQAPESLTVQAGQMVRVAVKGDKVGYLKAFRDEDAFFDELTQKNGERRFVFQSQKPGVYVLGFFTVGEDGGVATVITVLKPVPPTPPPAPAPPPAPEPSPKVDPAPPADVPIAADGLHVLVVYDAKTLSTLSEEQKAAIYGTDVRDYLRAHCPLTATNGQRGWQMWPDNADASGAPKLWRDAYARPRKSLPWIIVSNGRAGYEGPLPATAADTLSLLKKFGG